MSTAKISELTEKRYYQVLLAVFLMAIGLATIQIAFGFKKSAFNMDGRYHMAAADCLSNGKSPYSPESFFGCWERRTQTTRRSTYVFPPHAVLPVLPLAFLDRPLADFAILAWQFFAFGLLAWWSTVILRLAALDGPRRWLSTVWFGLGLTNTGILGSIYVGQLGLVTGAGLVGLALAAVFGKPRFWFIGLLLSMTKPHLTAFAAVTALLGAGAKDIKYKTLSLILLIISNIWIFIVDPSFLSNAALSLSYHAKSRFSNVSNPEQLFGIPGIFASAGWGFLLAAVMSLSIAAITSWRLSRNQLSRHATIMAAFSAAIIIGAMMVPHKQYDFAIYSVAFISAAILPIKIQALLIIPLIVVWRPSIVSIWELNERMGVNLCLLGTCTIFATVAVRGWISNKLPDTTFA